MDLAANLPLKGRRLLCVVAHPDDECFAFGGALSLAASQGVETYVICLTDGQAATNRGDASSSEHLGHIRRAEFAASCKVLGVAHVEVLDYQDAQLEFADFSHTAGRLVERIRTFKPDVVLTFGSDGGLNTHPDHTMVSAFATAAFHWAASAKRYQTTGTPFVSSRLFHLTTDVFLPDRPAPLPAPYSTAINIQTVLTTKREAFRQHASQSPLMEKTKDFFDEHGSAEFYVLVAAKHPQQASPLADLFDGI